MEVFCKQNPSDNPYWCNLIWGYCQFQSEDMINEHCPIYRMFNGGGGSGPIIVDDVTDEFMQTYSYATIYNTKNQLVSIGDTAFQMFQEYLELDVRYVRHIGKYAFQDCINLKTLDFSGKTDDYIPILDSPHAFMMQDQHTLVNETFQIIVPNSLLDKWRNSVNWSAVKNHIIGV